MGPWPRIWEIQFSNSNLVMGQQIVTLSPLHSLTIPPDVHIVMCITKNLGSARVHKQARLKSPKRLLPRPKNTRALCLHVAPLEPAPSR